LQSPYLRNIPWGQSGVGGLTTQRTGSDGRCCYCCWHRSTEGGGQDARSRALFDGNYCGSRRPSAGEPNLLYRNYSQPMNSHHLSIHRINSYMKIDKFQQLTDETKCQKNTSQYNYNHLPNATMPKTFLLKFRHQ
ncbi:sucrose-6F-phosphate phosphohydrolase 2, partial [Striga asiatica]